MTAPTPSELDRMTLSELSAHLMSRENAERTIATFEREIAKCESHLAHNTTHDEYGTPYTERIAGHRASIAWWQRHLATIA